MLPVGPCCVALVVVAGSYGSLAMFTNLQRMVKATDTCLIGGSGDYSDFQQVQRGWRVWGVEGGMCACL